MILHGCATTTVGVGASAVPGTYFYLTGELQATYSAPIEQLWPKTLEAMRKLRLTIDGQYLDATSGEIEGRRADGTPVKVRVKPAGKHSTTIGVQIGTPGSRTLAQFFHRAIQGSLTGNRMGEATEGAKQAMKRVTEVFLAPWQAADYAGLKVEAIYELLETGELAGEKVDGRWRIRKTVLDAWLDAEVSPEELEKLTTKMQGLTPEQARELLHKAQTE
jgi:excisionase family DNA binding protein